MKPLSKLEEYQFDLTGSNAEKISSKRAAIKREGLSGLSKKEIRKIQLENWAKRKRDNPKIPLFVLARQAKDSGWKEQAPVGVKVGKVTECYGLKKYAYDNYDWGRLRKHSTGNATCYKARTREENNGKGGWDRVVWRFRDYGCVISPDGRKLAYNFGNGWIVKSIRKSKLDGTRKFVGPNSVLILDNKAPILNTIKWNLRIINKRLQKTGFNSYLTYQTSEEIQKGLGNRSADKSKRLVCIVDLGKYGFYHCDQYVTPDYIREVIAKRKNELRSKEIDKLIQEGKTVWVGLEDSIKSGNCSIGTENFTEIVRKDYGNVGGIRSDYLLSLRDDTYTRRAIYVAFLRSSYLGVTV